MMSCRRRRRNWREAVEGAFSEDTAKSGRKGKGGCAEKQRYKDVG